MTRVTINVSEALASLIKEEAGISQQSVSSFISEIVARQVICIQKKRAGHTLYPYKGQSGITAQTRAELYQLRRGDHYDSRM